MFSNLLKKIFGSRNDRLVKQYTQVVRAINGLESTIAALSDQDLVNKTQAFKQQIANGQSSMNCYLKHSLSFEKLVNVL